MRPSEVVARHSQRILRLAKQFGLTDIRVFGSTAKEKDHENSDLDILVNAPKGTTLLDLIGLQLAIEDEFGISVDVLTEKELPEQFRNKVIKEAISL